MAPPCSLTLRPSSPIFFLPCSPRLASVQPPAFARLAALPPARLPAPLRIVSPRRPRARFSVAASAQLNILRALQATWKVAKNGIEAGAGLVPASVPRPIARIGVAVAAAFVALFLLKSFLSTLFFVTAMMGFIYFVYIAFNADEAPRVGDKSRTDEETTLEEARRIMEKYK